MTTPQGKAVSPELLRKLLRYDPETGKLFWRERPAEMFNSPRDCAAWNTRFSGVEALCSVNQKGYLLGYIFGARYRAHRVIFAMLTGNWPDDEVDHENGNRSDNRFENLRDVSRSENGRNKKRGDQNTSGMTGVTWYSVNRKWRAYINADKGRPRHLGYFSDFNEAVAARKAAENELGYHKNHGRAS